MTNSRLDTTNESQEVSPFPAGVHKAHANKQTLTKHSKHKVETRNVSIGHGCPRYCQIRINRALSLTKGHNSDNNRWILSVIKLYLCFMITCLCMKYESIGYTNAMYSKDMARKPFFIWRPRAITLIIIGGFYL